MKFFSLFLNGDSHTKNIFLNGDSHNRVSVLIAVAVMLALGACTEQEEAAETGTVTITLGLPSGVDLSGFDYMLSFTYEAYSSVHKDEPIEADKPLKVQLPIGTWEIDAVGYEGVEIVTRGSATVVVLPGENIMLTIQMDPIDTGTGTGTLAYTVSLPEGLTAKLSITQLNSTVLIAMAGNPANLASGTSTGTITLPTGVYRLHLDISPDLAGYPADLSVSIYIYKNKITEFTYDEYNNLVTPPAILVTYWYGTIPISGPEGAFLIVKGGNPDTIKFTAPDLYHNIVWYVGIEAKSTDLSLEVKAADYEKGTYNITFTGQRKDTENSVYSERFILTVDEMESEGKIDYTVVQVGGRSHLLMTKALLFTFAEPVEGLEAGSIIINGTGSVVKGVLTGSGTEWRLQVKEAVEGTVNIVINKAGIDHSVHTAEVYSLGKLVWVGAGEYEIGGRNATGGSPGEGYMGTHKVELTQGFYISDHEVIGAEWFEVMNNKPWEAYGDTAKDLDETYPAFYINWYHMIAYCNKRSLLDGFEPVYEVPGINWETLTFAEIPTLDPPASDWGSDPVWEQVTWNKDADGYRLPTEAEWEVAACGAALTENYSFSGSNDLGEVAWYKGNSPVSPDFPEPVMLKKPNELGLYDMSGNVQEFVWDRFEAFDKTYVESLPNGIAEDPTGADSSVTVRTIRNGSYKDDDANCYISYRGNYEPSVRGKTIGFRVVRN